jgi:hypothetical protein
MNIYTKLLSVEMMQDMFYFEYAYMGSLSESLSEYEQRLLNMNESHIFMTS